MTWGEAATKHDLLCPILYRGVVPETISKRFAMNMIVVRELDG